MEFILTNNLLGLLIGIITFLVIGLFHHIVIKTEYFFRTDYWWVFLLKGIAGAIISMLLTNVLLSVAAGVLSFSSFWNILGLFEQKNA